MRRIESGPHRLGHGTALKAISHSQTSCGPGAGQAGDGEQRKVDAHVLLEARRELYILRGRRALLLRLLDVGRATADDVRDAVELPEAVGPKLFGVVPGLLARARIIEAVGFAKSRRPDAHARPVSVWQLVDRAAALAWLTDNPDRPDPEPAEDLPLFAARGGR